MTIIAITGHRDLSHPEAAIRQSIQNTFEEANPEGVLIGMGPGFDLLAGDVARQMQVPYMCAVPWTGHTPKSADENLYYGIINYAARVVYLSDNDDFPGKYIYQKRNEYMVDNCTHVLAYRDPTTQSGGTVNTINYAAKVGRPVRNLFDRIPPF